MRRGFKVRLFSVLLIFIFAFILMTSFGCKITSKNQGSFLDKATSLTSTTSSKTTQTSLKGRVIDAADGKGINNLTVTTEGNLITKTDNDGINDGMFYFENIPADKTKDISFVISVSGSGFETTYRTITIKSSDYGKLVDTTDTSRGGPIKIYRTSYAQKGYVVGRVLNADGKALDGVTVETEELDVSTGQPYITHTTSTGMPKAGMFKLELPAAPPDNEATYTIIIKASGYDYYTIKDLTVVRLETQDLGDIKLSEATESVETRNIIGRVVDEDTGYGIDGAVVSTEGGISVTSGNTSPKIHQGDFIIKDAPLGTYYIFVTKSGYMDYSKLVTVTSGTDNLDIGDLSLSKGPAETVYGKVYDSDSYEGINDITVEIKNYDSTFYKSTHTSRINGTDGLYRFNNNIPIDDNHEYIVTARADDYVPKSKLVTVNSTDSTTNNAVDIPLTKIDFSSGPVLYGYVYEQDNVTQPISLATVEIYKTSGGNYIPAMTVETDVDGYYVVQGLAQSDSPIKIIVTKSGYKQGDKEDFAITSATGKIQLPPIFLDKLSGKIYGTVYVSDNDDDDGTDYNGGITDVISDATVKLINRLTGSSVTTTSKLDGSYIFQDLTEGDYIIAAEKAGAYDLHFYTVSVTPTSYSIKQDIELKPTTGNAGDGFLVGTVVSSVDKRPIKDATVKIVGSGTGVGEDDTDLAGKFNISYNPGTYVVTATATNYSNAYQDSVTLESGKVTSLTFELTPTVGKITGVVSSNTGNIIGGATVELLYLSDEVVVTPIFTDYNAGQYSFYDVPFGNYKIKVSAEHYYSKEQRITLNGKLLTVNFTLSPMIGGVEGHTYYDENGNGVYDAGEGVEGVKVSLTDFSDTSNVITTAYSSPSGLYQISGITAGSYKLLATSEVYASLTREANIVAGATVEVNFSLRKTGSKLYGLVYDDLNNNGNADSGEGLEGATVELWQDGNKVSDFKTLTGGSYEFSGIATGQYIVKASYSTSTLTYSNASYLIDITADPLRKDIVLSPLFGTVTGSITDEAGDPISGATITYSDASESYFVTYSDTQGTFTFENVSEGAKTFKVSASDYYTPTSQNLYVKSGEKYKLFFTLKINRGRIYGTVKDAISGTLLSGVSTILYDLNGLTIDSKLTNSDGEYWLIGISEGDYKLVFEKENYESTYRMITVQAGISTEISTVNLQPQLGGISGSVTDAVDGSLLNGVTVLIKPQDAVAAGFTSKELTVNNGKFEQYNLKEGFYDVGAHKYPLYQDLTKEVEVKRAESVAVSFPLYPITGGLSVEVVDAASGDKLANALLSAESGSINVYTNVSGTALLTGLQEGQQKIAVSKAPYYQTAYYYANVEVGKIKGPYTFSLTPVLGGVSGEVDDLLDDKPLTGVSVGLYAAIGGIYQYIRTVYTNSEGIFELTGISEGANRLKFEKDQYMTKTLDITVTAGQDFSAGKIYLESVFGGISGEVVDKSTSAAISGAKIKVEEYPTISTTTDNEGNFSLTGITAGDVHLLVSATPEYAANVSFLVSVEAGQTKTIKLQLSKVLGEISGIIYDAYSNAVLSGATVIYKMVSPSVYPEKTYITNSNGEYDLTGLTAGTYKISAVKSDYLTNEISVNIATGEVSTGNNVYLYKNASGELSGEVIDAQLSTPIQGVTVSVDGYPSVYSVTDASGHFYFNNLTPEVLFSLNFEKDGYNSTTLSVPPLKGGQKKYLGQISMNQLGAVSGRVLLDGATPQPLSGITVSSSGIQAVTGYDGSYILRGLTFGTHTILADGTPKYNSAHMDVYLDANNSVLTDINLMLKKQELTLSGEVQDADTQERLAGATITVAGLTAETDNNGMFIITGITPGVKTIKVSLAPEYSVLTRVINFEENQDVTGVIFKLEKGKASLAGTVKNKFTGQFLAGISVYVTTSNIAKTQLDGSFLLTGIDEGNQRIWVDGGADFSKEAYTIYFDKGENVTGTTFELEPIYAYKVYGTVTDLSGNSIENALINIEKNGTILTLHDYTDSNALYEITGLSVGTYTLRVDATNKRYDLLTREVVINNTKTSYRMDFQLQTNIAGISGKVSDASSNPITGATVSSYLGGLNGEVTHKYTQYDGSYSFDELTGEKSYLIQVTKDGYMTEEKWVDTTSGSTINNIDFTLTYILGGISGSVTDLTTGSSLSGVSVTLTNEAGVLVDSIKTDYQGKFSFSKLKPGRYHIGYTVENYVPEEDIIVVNTSETVSVNKRLQRNWGSIKGTVSDTLNAPIFQVLVKYGDKQAYTDNNGNYVLQGITQGLKAVTFSAEGYAKKDINVDVLAGQTVTLNAQLTSLYGNIRGTVLDYASSAPLTGATVRVSGLDTSNNVFIKTGIVDLNGKFLIKDIYAGNVTVEVFDYPDYTSFSTPAIIPAGETLTLSDIKLHKGVGNLHIQVYEYNPTTGISTELVGATVELYDDSSNLVTTKLSDISGKAKLDNLNPGTYKLKVSKDMYSTYEANVDAISGITVPINVYLDTEFGDIQGTVQDVHGNLLSGVTVMLFTSESSYLTYTTNRSAYESWIKEDVRTDVTGSYSFKKVKTGNYYVVAEKDDYMSYESKGGVSFTLSKGETESVTPLILVRNYGRIEGTIVGVLDPLYFQSNPQDSNNFIPLSGVTYWYAKSGAAVNYNDPHYALQFGSFEINDLSEGTYKVVAKHNNFDTGEAYVSVIAGETTSQYIFCQNIYGSFSGTVQEVVGGVTNLLSGATVTITSTTLPTAKTYTVKTNSLGVFSIPNVRVNNGSSASSPNEYKELYDIEIAASGYATYEAQEWVLAGRTTSIIANMTSNVGKLKVTLVDANAQPISNAKVGIHSSTLAGETVSTTTAGVALFKDLTEGNYNILAGDGSFAYETAEATATVVAGVTTSVQLTLYASKRIVYGTVKGADNGQIIQGATVTITDAYGTTTTVTTEADGVYQAKGIKAGQLTLIAKAEGYESKTEIQNLDGNTLEVNFSLQPALQPTVSGYVKAEGTNMGIQNVKVTAINIISGISYTAYTDSSGQYTFTDVRYGTYHLTAEPSTNDYQIGQGTGTVDSTNNTFADIYLKHNTGAIYGFVVDSGNREGIKGISVYLTDVGGVTPIQGAQYLSDGNGYFVISGITYGRYDIHFVDSAATTAEAFPIRGESVTYQSTLYPEFEVNVGTTVEMNDITMVRSPNYGSVYGYALFWYIMTDPTTGKTVEAYKPFTDDFANNIGITIEFYLGSVTDAPTYWTTTDADGFYRMNNLSEGKWTIVTRWQTQEAGNPRYLIPYTIEVDVKSGINYFVPFNWYDFHRD
jgi:hypothetical protein